MKLVYKLLIFFPIIIYAKENIDSLEYELNRTIGKDKVDIFNELSRLYLEKSIDKSLKYINQALKLSYKYKYNNGIANALLNKGKYYYKIHNYDKALDYLFKALNIFRNIGNQYKIAYSSIIIGAINYNKRKYNISLKYYKNAMNICNEIKDLDLLALSFNSIGTIYYKLSKYDSTLYYHFKALIIYEENKEKTKIASTMYSIGTGFTALCSYDKAIEYYLKSLLLFEEIKDKEGIVMTYHAIGSVYQDLRNYNKSLYYNLEALKLKRYVNEKYIIASLLTSIGDIYFYLSKYDSSLFYSNKSITISNEIYDKTTLVMSYNTKGNIHYVLGEYDKALDCYLNAKDFIQLSSDKWLKAKTVINIGKVYIKLKKYNKAYKNLKLGLNFSKSIKTKDLLHESYKNLSDYNSEIGNYKMAYHYLKLFSDLKDSVFTESNHRIAEMQIRYETDKREKENQILKSNNFIQNLELEKQNLIKWRLYFGLVIVSILVFFIYYRYRSKLKINIELRKKITAAIKKNKEQQQIIFHQASLTSLGELVAGLAHEINQPLQNIYLATQTLQLELKEEHPDYSIITLNVNDISNNITRVRNIIDHIRIFSSKQKDEIFTNFNVNDYINKALLLVEKQYIKKGIKIDLKTSDDVILLTGNPYKYEQIILNLLSNARDALLEKSKISKDNPPMNIKIEIYQNNKEIITIVEDNGIGILADKISEIFTPFYTTKRLGEGSGLGMSITKNIVQEMHGRIKIVSKQNEGTRIIIKLPNN